MTAELRRDSIYEFTVSHSNRPRRESITEITLTMPNQIKRARAGSISGRLRAASDLADFGLIDMSQKNVIKVFHTFVSTFGKKNCRFRISNSIYIHGSRI